MVQNIGMNQNMTQVDYESDDDEGVTYGISATIDLLDCSYHDEDGVLESVDATQPVLIRALQKAEEAARNAGVPITLNYGICTFEEGGDI